ncbi:MAG: right-handed parallel beta-helix repeat-containing protein [Anaerolineae bacterium]|nr:right-handed parallel beta-helix repeat-containing protein [Anaerolineae bacterium]
MRQAILDANSNPGHDTITFNIPTTDPNYSNWTGTGDYWWKITITSALPTITDAVTIDGTTQTANQGDKNPGQVGTGGTVGVDAVPLPKYDKPEIEIDGSRNGGTGFTIFTLSGSTSNITLKGMALFNARRGIQSTGASSGTNRVVTDMLIGMRADGSDPGTTMRIINFGVDVQSPSQLTVTRSYVGYCGQSGIVGVLSASVVSITYNEVFANGWNSSAHDGIDVDGINGEVRYNLSRDNTCTTTAHGCGNGIELGSQDAGTGGNVIENNTVLRNKQGITIRKGSSNNTIRKNIITANQGPGVLIADESTNPTSGNRISQNSIYDNAGLGIDLSNDTTTTPNGVTPNNGTKDTTHPNHDMDFPIITAATLHTSTNYLHIVGYVGSAPGQNTFANARLEFFIAAPDPTGYGEGKVFLGECNSSTTDGNFDCYIDVSNKGMTSSDYITGTATDGNGNTSEFGPNFRTAPTAVTLSSFHARTESDNLPVFVGVVILAFVAIGFSIGLYKTAR